MPTIVISPLEVVEKFKFVGKYILSKPEKEILRLAANSGEIYVFDIDQPPYKVLRVDNTDPCYKNDSYKNNIESLKYYEALESLCSKGYIKKENEHFFRLTSHGFSKAKKLVRDHKIHESGRDKIILVLKLY